MNTEVSRKTGLLLTFLASTVIFLPATASTAGVVWEENFESGLDNWDFSGFNGDFAPVPGNFSDTGGILRITGDEDQENVAEHSSTQAIGTWSFDVDVTPTKRNHFYIAFFGGKMGNFTNMSDFSAPYEYGVVVVTGSIGSWNEEFVFYRRPEGSSSVVQLGRYAPGKILGWHQFDITRNAEGEIEVYIGGKLRSSFKDDVYTATEVFRFSGGPGPGIDNIVVQDDISPPPAASGFTASAELLALSLLFVTLFKRKRGKINHDQ